MLENHLRSMYRLLGHQGSYSRVGALNYSTRTYKEDYVKGEEAVLAWAKQYDQKANVFISRGFFDESKQFKGCWTFTLDLDPIRPKESAATEDQLAKALDVGRHILSRYPGGYLSCSGNGALLVYRLDSLVTNPDHYKKESVLLDEIQKEFNNEHVRIDSTSYPTALIKAIGTLSTKGEISLRRCSRWLDYPLYPFRNCSKLLQRLNEIKPGESITKGSINVQQLHSKFNGDRSTADYHLVSFLKRSGVGPADALAALQANPLGRQDDEKDQARLITKIYGDVLREGNTSDVAGSYFDRLFQADSQLDGAVRTGIRSLDTCIRALPKGEITTFAARSGFGKSSFACTVADTLRGMGKSVLYFSLEMQKDYILHKLVGIHCDIPVAQLLEKRISEAERKRIRAYEQELLRTPIIICDEFQPTLELVRNKVIQHKPDLLIFDHISNVGTHWENIAQFARGLKEIAIKEEMPILMLSQLNEPPRTKDGSVSQSVRGDVRGTQEIIYLSALFMFVSNPYEVKTNVQPVNINIVKNRYGISGMVVPVSVNKETGKFYEKEAINVNEDVSPL